jgi:hypothetical protein
MIERAIVAGVFVNTLATEPLALTRGDSFLKYLMSNSPDGKLRDALAFSTLHDLLLVRRVTRQR